MKRFTPLLALLLSLTAASIATAAGGPGKFETKITGQGATTAHGMLDGTWTIDLANAHSGHINLTRNGKSLGGGTYLISESTIKLTPKKGGKCTTKAKYQFNLGRLRAVQRQTIEFRQWDREGARAERGIQAESRFLPRWCSWR